VTVKERSIHPRLQTRPDIISNIRQIIKKHLLRVSPLGFWFSNEALLSCCWMRAMADIAEL